MTNCGFCTCFCAGTSSKGKLVDPLELVSRLPADRPVVFVFGAISRGEYKADYVEETYSFSQYPVRAPVCHAMSHHAMSFHTSVSRQGHRMPCVLVWSQLSAATAINRLLGAFETAWDVL